MPRREADKMEFSADILGQRLVFSTREGLFSPAHVDRGTLAMLAVAEDALVPGARVMDLGCGYGVVGVLAATRVGAQNVVMADTDPVAVECARENAAKNGVPGVTVCLSDGFDQVDATGFDAILVNPPYQTDFRVARKFILKGFNRLKIGGRMFMVTKRREWYKNRLVAVFGGVRIREADGYCIFEAERRREQYASSEKRS